MRNVHVSTNIVLLLCPFSGLLLFSLLLMLFNKPEMKLTYYYYYNQFEKPQFDKITQLQVTKIKG